MQILKSSMQYNSRVIFLHPLTIQSLHEALINSGISRTMPQSINLQEASDESRKSPVRFLIHTRNEIKVVLFDEVVCCVADSNYTHIHLRDGRRLMVSKTLKEVETILFPLYFVRIHASHLINLHFIRRILKTHHYIVELTNHIILDVSRSRQEELMQKMKMS